MCQGGTVYSLRTTDQCTGADGNTYNKGDIEEYWTNCETAVPPQCQDNLGLVAFRVNAGGTGPDIFDQAQCLEITTYKVGVNEVITDEVFAFGTCDLRTQDNFGAPAQLWRVLNGSLNPATQAFVYDSSGPFVKLVHRPSGMFVGPQLLNRNLTQPIYGESLALYIGRVPVNIPPGELTSNRYYVVGDQAIDPDGYWWFLMPPTFDPNYGGADKAALAAMSTRQKYVNANKAQFGDSQDPPPPIDATYNGTLQYLTYVPDLNNVLAAYSDILTNEVTLWNYVSGNKPPILTYQPNSPPTIVPAIIFDLNVDDPAPPANAAATREAAFNASVQIYDSSILNIILQRPSSFVDF
jgi:hypothetical protein